jgi:hypothetical protein
MSEVALRVMRDEGEPTQETQPAKGKPVTIPVPTKADVMAALRRVAKTDEKESDD